MMSQFEERSISQYPFTLSGYPKKMHSVLYGSSDLLFLEGILAMHVNQKYESGHFWFEVAPSLVGGLMLDRSMGRSVLDVCCKVKCFDP
jgi:hypothetical protein